MKVCIIHSIFSPYSRGGAEVVVEATASAFVQAGHEVFVITCAPFAGWGSLAGKWQGKGDVSLFEAKRETSPFPLRIFRFTPLNLFTIFNLGKYPALLRLIWHVLDMFNPHTYLVVKKILAREKPDLIITRNLKGLGYTIPMAIRHSSLVIRHSVQWFHGLHDLGALHPRGFMEWGKENAIRKPMVLIKLYREITKRLFGSPDAIVAPSQFVLQEYERAGFFPKSKKVVLGNPVAYKKLQEVTGRYKKLQDVTVATLSNLTQPLVTSGNFSIRFLYIGQLEPYKGIRVLLDAWKKFIVDHPDALLEIAGVGSLEDEVRRAASHIRGIQYHGFVPHEKLPALMSGVCATILPTLAYETFGLSIIESFAAGVPVIASRIGATPEIVEDGVNGYLVTPNDPSALCRALMNMVGASWNTLSENAQQSAEMYTMEKYYAALYKMYTGCIS